MNLQELFYVIDSGFCEGEDHVAKQMRVVKASNEACALDSICVATEDLFAAAIADAILDRVQELPYETDVDSDEAHDGGIEALTAAEHALELMQDTLSDILIAVRQKLISVRIYNRVNGGI
jgi:hypothetical protein